MRGTYQWPHSRTATSHFGDRFSMLCFVVTSTSEMINMVEYYCMHDFGGWSVSSILWFPTRYTWKPLLHKIATVELFQGLLIHMELIDGCHTASCSGMISCVYNKYRTVTISFNTRGREKWACSGCHPASATTPELGIFLTPAKQRWKSQLLFFFTAVRQRWSSIYFFNFYSWCTSKSFFFFFWLTQIALSNTEITQQSVVLTIQRSCQQTTFKSGRLRQVLFPQFSSAQRAFVTPSVQADTWHLHQGAAPQKVASPFVVHSPTSSSVSLVREQSKSVRPNSSCLYTHVRYSPDIKAALLCVFTARPLNVFSFSEIKPGNRHWLLHRAKYLDLQQTGIFKAHLFHFVLFFFFFSLSKILISKHPHVVAVHVGGSRRSLEQRGLIPFTGACGLGACCCLPSWPPLSSCKRSGLKVLVAIASCLLSNKIRTPTEFELGTSKKKKKSCFVILYVVGSVSSCWPCCDCGFTGLKSAFVVQFTWNFFTCPLKRFLQGAKWEEDENEKRGSNCVSELMIKVGQKHVGSPPPFFFLRFIQCAFILPHVVFSVSFFGVPISDLS